jgi:hypothetical protein
LSLIDFLIGRGAEKAAGRPEPLYQTADGVAARNGGFSRGGAFAARQIVPH